jgi:hypothetical protein
MTICSNSDNMSKAICSNETTQVVNDHLHDQRYHELE